jgi:hypothetical protein
MSADSALLSAMGVGIFDYYGKSCFFQGPVDKHIDKRRGT